MNPENTSGERGTLPDIFEKFPSSEMRYILNSIPYGIVIIDMKKRIRFINDLALELSGFSSKDDLTGRICHRTLCPTEMDNCPILDKGMEFDRTERKLLTESGNEIPVLKTALRINLGDEDFLLETFIDLRNMKELAEAFRKSEEKYELIFENTGSGMIIYDEKGRVLLVNREMLEITGRDFDYFKGMPEFTEFIYQPDKKRVWDMHVSLTNEPNPGIKHGDAEFRLLRDDGNVLIIHAIVSVIPGTRVSVASLIDITELRQAENELNIANNKLKTLFKITRHDINNQLTSLSLILDIIRNSDNKQENEALIGNAAEIVESIAAHIEFTKEYEQIGLEKPEWINFTRVLERVSRSYDFNKLSFNNLIDGDLFIYCDRMIDRVLYNIFENSVRHGGDVKEIEISFSKSGDDGVLTIRDNGWGISPDAKSKIFEEGYGDNTGFGLFIIKSILEITRIEIRETGVFGEGACFEMAIPKGNYYCE